MPGGMELLPLIHQPAAAAKQTFEPSIFSSR